MRLYVSSVICHKERGCSKHIRREKRERNTIPELESRYGHQRAFLDLAYVAKSVPRKSGNLSDRMLHAEVVTARSYTPRNIKREMSRLIKMEDFIPRPPHSPFFLFAVSARCGPTHLSSARCLKNFGLHCTLPECIISPGNGWSSHISTCTHTE